MPNALPLQTSDRFHEIFDVNGASAANVVVGEDKFIFAFH